MWLLMDLADSMPLGPRPGRLAILLRAFKMSGLVISLTLSKIINHPGHSTVTDNLDKLCNYFNCRIEQLVTHIQDSPAMDEHQKEENENSKD